MLATLGVLAAACSDPAALNPAASDGEAAFGPTIVTTDDGVEPTIPTSPPLPTIPPMPTLPPPPPPADPVTVLAVGNPGVCNAHSGEVAEAMAADVGQILLAGDLSLDGSQTKIDECFSPALGSELDRVRAVPGNRDLATDDGAAYYALVAQTPTETTAGEGWFVTSLGGWQIIGLNSQCEAVGGCGPGSAQYQWLDALLRDQPAACRAVVWHDARFTSTAGEDDAIDMGPILGRLDGAGIALLITGSPGNYERLGPIRPSGQLAGPGEPGTMHFNIGGGSGAGYDAVLQPGSKVRKDVFNGYVRFVFSPEGYTWEFVATSEGTSEPDVGSGTC